MDLVGKNSRGESPKQRRSKKEKPFGASAFDFPIQSFLVNAYFAGRDSVAIDAIYHEMRVRMMPDPAVRDALGRLVRIGYVSHLGNGNYKALKADNGQILPKRIRHKNDQGVVVIHCPSRCARGYGMKSFMDELYE